MAHKYKYRFGGLLFEINSPVPLLEKEELSAFKDEGEADIVCDVVCGKVGDTVYDKNRITVYTGNKDLSSITVANLFGFADVGACLPDHKRFILHCSYVVTDGEAILITAPSGTGKSTLARHFRDSLGAQIVNEDRAILFSENGKYFAAGCWAMGSADTCLNVTAPLRAVVILSQGRDNRILPMGSGEKLSKILPQCTFNDKSFIGKVRIIEEVSDLVTAVNVVSYECINAPSAAFELEKSI